MKVTVTEKEKQVLVSTPSQLEMVFYLMDFLTWSVNLK